MSIFYITIFMTLWWGFLYVLNIQSSEVVSFFKRLYCRNNYEELCIYLVEGKLCRQVPEYKFFSSIIENLIKFRKLYGIDILPAARQIRGAARRDYTAGKKLRGELVGFVVQYGTIACFTWIFIYRISVTMEMSFSSGSLFGLLIWQLLGLVFGVSFYFILVRKIFGIFQYYFSSAYTFRSLIDISRPISEVTAFCGLDRLPESKEFTVIKKRFLGIIEKVKVTGVIVVEEIDQIILELWDSYELSLNKFNAMLGGLKLITILLFVFTGFLYVIFLSMEQLSI